MFSHSSVDRNLVVSTAINICVQVCMWTYTFVSLGYIPKNTISGSYYNCLILLKNHQIVSQSSCPISHPPSNILRVQIFSHFTNIIFLFKNIVTILVSRKWYIVVLFCISLVTANVEHLLIYLLAICISSVEKCPGPLSIFIYLKKRDTEME